MPKLTNVLVRRACVLVGASIAVAFAAHRASPTNAQTSAPTTAPTTAPATSPARAARRPMPAYVVSAAPRSGEATGSRGDAAPQVFAPLVAGADGTVELKFGYASLPEPSFYFWLPAGSGEQPVRITLGKKSATDPIFDVHLKPLPRGLHRVTIDVGLGDVRLEPGVHYRLMVAVGNGEQARAGSAFVIFRDDRAGDTRAGVSRAGDAASTDRWFDAVDAAAAAYLDDASDACLAALQDVLAQEGVRFDPRAAK